jgi:hypothetical protein
MESPLDPLVHSEKDEEISNVWERVRASAEQPRRLGRANALVARSLLLAPDAAPIEGESAAAIALQATGWVAWVDRCLPGEGSLLSPPRLPFGAEALPELRPWIEALRAGLVAREAAMGELRTMGSRSLSQA